ncbi:MAG: hypothetical protein IT379_18920, partial [Deltaproteobacteria bacterium]|nr:hypothetical protein [Deltaproteobacteria bacterium]
MRGEHLASSRRSTPHPASPRVAGRGDARRWGAGSVPPFGWALLAVLASCSLDATDPVVPPFQEDPEHACGNPRDGARACQITRRGQRIGGPSSVADVGDYLLENDHIRVAILAAGNSPGPGLFGGSIVDADIVRPSVSSVVGQDRFAEIFPIVNFAVPGDPVVTANGALEPFNEGVGPMRVEVLCPGDTCPEAYRTANAAVIRVTAKGASLISALDALRLLSVQSDLSFQTDYILEPERRWVRMHTEVINDRCRDPGLSDDEVFASPSSRTPLQAIEPGLSPFEIMLGDSLRFGTGDPIETAPGVAGGDFLLFGPKLSLFTPGFGYGTKLYFLESFERRIDTLGDPPMPDYMAGVSGDVSYGYFGDGPIQVPILTGSFTAAFSGERRLPYPENPTPGDECAIEEYVTGTFSYDRYFVVGDGDAGSIARARFEITGQPFGTIAGNVVEAGSLRPQPHADVIVVRDPDPSAPVPSSIRAAMDQNLAADGNPGVVMALKTDRGLDADLDGSFDGPVPPGTYLVVARTSEVPPGAPLRVVVNAGETVRGTVLLSGGGTLRYRVVDERGAASPAKLTILDDDLTGTSACATGGVLSPRGTTARSPRRHVELGDGELPDGIARIVYTTSGEGQVALEPGRYEIIASRGIERGIDRACITIAPGSTEHVTFAVPLEVDSPGWISGDFHVHGQLSFDSSVPHEARIRSAVGEGLELFASTDHDWVADLGPTVRGMQLEHLVATLVGIETTTLETGHFIGFPLRYDATRSEGGAIDWSRRDACLLAPTGPRCTEGPEGTMLPLTPAEIFAALRDLGSLGPSETAVMVPHPRDGFFGYFDQFDMSAYDLAINEAGFLSSGNPLLRRPYWSRAFDSIEIMNGKRYELLRTPTAGEVSAFAATLD